MILKFFKVLIFWNNFPDILFLGIADLIASLKMFYKIALPFNFFVNVKLLVTIIIRNNIYSIDVADKNASD